MRTIYILAINSIGSHRIQHKDGEIDMRGTYCAIATASMLGILTEELTKDVDAYDLHPCNQ